MAARLATIGVLLVALVVMAEASLNPTMEIEGEGKQYQRERCRQQMRGRRLRSCQQYLQRGGGGGMLRRFGGGHGESLEDCCRELRNMEPMCMCEAIEQAMDEAMMEQMGGFGGGRRGYGGRQEEREMMRMAENLPSMCGMDRPRRCEMMGY